jgi:decaprenylphospho-beta-D-ribofuranose 2-oxidase
MIIKKKENTNWGNNIKTYPKIYEPRNYYEIKKIINNNKSFVVQGNQRSFGDGGLNKNQVLSMKNFNKIISFDSKSGIVEAESGLLLKDLLPTITEKGWFLAVTPGTKYVSLGGMAANNVIGKNTNNNQIKYHIKRIKLMMPNKKVIFCSKTKNKKIFNLTIGGFGLTGIILAVTFKLKKIHSKNIEQKLIEFNTYKEFYKISKKSKKYEYSVCWIDNFNNKKIQGLYHLGNHSKQKIYRKSGNFIFKKMGFFTLVIFRIINSNYFLPKVLNFIFRNYKKKFYKKICHYNDFFYPQDNVPYWNKVYGSKGFIQIQFLIPKNKFEVVLNEISIFLNKYKIFSIFIVLKKIKEKGNYLNFSGEGYSVSFDFGINKKQYILKSFLNNIFKKYKLRVNFTKDLITSKNNVSNYKEFQMFKKSLLKINPRRKISSLLSKRLEI